MAGYGRRQGLTIASLRILLLRVCGDYGLSLAQCQFKVLQFHCVPSRDIGHNEWSENGSDT